jgi:hypothetical protein
MVTKIKEFLNVTLYRMIDEYPSTKLHGATSHKTVKLIDIQPPLIPRSRGNIAF